MGWIAPRGDASAYKYLLRGIENFPTAEEFSQELASLGFSDISFEPLTLGIVAIHTARKPSRGDPPLVIECPEASGGSLLRITESDLHRTA